MVHVNETTQAGTTPPRASDDVVELILGELDPIIARTRDVLARVWHDRSVSKANLHVLMLLEQFGSLPMSRLATMIDVSLPSMTGIVDRMEENGLIERERTDEDRRVVMVRCTPRGEELAREMPRLRREYLRRVVVALPEGDRRNCYAAFRAFRLAAESLAEEAAHEEHALEGPAGLTGASPHECHARRGRPTNITSQE